MLCNLTKKKGGVFRPLDIGLDGIELQRALRPLFLGLMSPRPRPVKGLTSSTWPPNWNRGLVGRQFYLPLGQQDGQFFDGLSVGPLIDGGLERHDRASRCSPTFPTSSIYLDKMDQVLCQPNPYPVLSYKMPVMGPNPITLHR